MKRELFTRWREVAEVLFARLRDPDPDVQRIALDNLQRLAGRDFPSTADGIAQWRAWLDQSR